jgi:small subunit ribosomal protein S20
VETVSVANTPSARKRARQAAKRALINKSRKSRIKTFVRKVEAALAAGDVAAAKVAFALAEPEIRRGVSKGVLHLNTASRKISRLAQRIKALDLQRPPA